MPRAGLLHTMYSKLPKKAAAPFGLRNTAETLMKTVIPASAAGQKKLRRLRNLTVSRKPARTVGYSAISAFGAS